MNTKILIIDDEEYIVELLQFNLETLDYEVDYSYDGFDGFLKAKESKPDLILLDWMLPNISGIDVLKKIREDKDLKNIPVIMLSARGEEYDKLFGFEIGIEDYVVKPFSPKELMARIKVAINRNSKKIQINNNDRLVFEGLEIDLAGRDVYVNGKKINMTPKEYDLLFYLVRNNNLALSRNKLLENVWGYDFFGDDRTVDTHIKMLRNSLGEYRKFIVTLRGMGYKFEAN